MVAVAMNCTFEPSSRASLHRVRVRIMRASASATTSFVKALPSRYATSAKGSITRKLDNLLQALNEVAVRVAQGVGIDKYLALLVAQGVDNLHRIAHRHRTCVALVAKAHNLVGHTATGTHILAIALAQVGEVLLLVGLRLLVYEVGLLGEVVVASLFHAHLRRCVINIADSGTNSLDIERRVHLQKGVAYIQSNDIGESVGLAA